MSGSARKQRRRDEQAAFEAIYMLGGPDVAQAYCDEGIPTKQLVRATSYETRTQPRWRRSGLIYERVHRFRSYRCPHCHGSGVDPEQHPAWQPDWGPPDPCGFCNGEGVIEPRHYRLERMASEAQARPKREREGQNGGNGQNGFLRLEFFE